MPEWSTANSSEREKVGERQSKWAPTLGASLQPSRWLGSNWPAALAHEPRSNLDSMRPAVRSNAVPSEIAPTPAEASASGDANECWA